MRIYLIVLITYENKQHHSCESEKESWDCSSCGHLEKSSNNRLIFMIDVKRRRTCELIFLSKIESWNTWRKKKRTEMCTHERMEEEGKRWSIYSMKAVSPRPNTTGAIHYITRFHMLRQVSAGVNVLTAPLSFSTIILSVCAQYFTFKFVPGRIAEPWALSLNHLPPTISHVYIIALSASRALLRHLTRVDIIFSYYA